MNQTLLPFSTQYTRRQMRLAQDRRNRGGSTENEARLAALERHGRYGVQTYIHPKRCPKCGTINIYRRPDGVCLGCAMKEERK